MTRLFRLPVAPLERCGVAVEIEIARFRRFVERRQPFYRNTRQRRFGFHGIVYLGRPLQHRE
jgi:hypothetical protein